MERSPLALPFPTLGPIAGVRIGTASVAYKKWTRDCVTLVELAPAMAAHVAKDGLIILSGLLVVQAEAVTAAYVAEGFVPEAREDLGEWSALVLRR